MKASGVLGCRECTRIYGRGVGITSWASILTDHSIKGGDWWNRRSKTWRSDHHVQVRKYQAELTVTTSHLFKLHISRLYGLLRRRLRKALTPIWSLFIDMLPLKADRVSTALIIALPACDRLYSAVFGLTPWRPCGVLNAWKLKGRASASCMGLKNVVLTVLIYTTYRRNMPRGPGSHRLPKCRQPTYQAISLNW